MSAAAARSKTTPPPAADPRQMDAAGLRAFAEAALQDGAPAPQGRRGPFRPEQLVSSRARQSGLEAVRFFRAADVAGLIALAVAVTAAVTPASLLSTPLRDILPFAAGAGLSAWLLAGFELYRFGRNERLGAHLGKVGVAFAASGVFSFALAVLTGVDARMLTALVVWFALALMTVHSLHVLWWGTVRRWRANGRLTPNIVVVGATRHAERLIEAALSRRDVNVIGVFDDRLARAPESVGGVPVLGDTQALLEHRVTPYVDRVVVALDPGARNRVRELVQRLRVLPNEVSLLVDLETEDDRDAALTRLADAPLTRVAGGRPENDRRAFAKRVQDLVIGAVAALLLAPVMTLIALLVRLDSPGPIFFRQRRHGFNNETITVWKFRTMRHEAADPRAERQVVADDERVTRLGRVLRKFSLDELPQLINVLKGEMSLVGPRPHAVGMKTGEADSHRIVSEYAWRHRMKPGMTGWAAIKGSRGPLHSAADVRRRVALDIEYIERQSFWLDLYVMLMTVPCLLGDRHAIR
jgi:Undecaprenyl-phosphate glucose phosphotransferase